MVYFKTFLLMFGLTVLFSAVGYAIGGTSGAIFALIFAGGMNFFAYYRSDSLVIKMTKAKEAKQNEYPEYYSIVNNLIVNNNMPMPKLYILDQDVPNAFATGRNPNNSAVAVTKGLMAILNKNELSGVIAHELAHIKNRDTLISTISATFAAAISMLANMFMWMNLFGRGENRTNPIVGIIVMLVAPIAATVIQLAISRQREYLADKVGGNMCGNPLYLASALKKLEAYNAKPHKEGELASSTAHLFIVNPFQKSHKKDNLFSTHPNTYNRITALELQAKYMGFTLYDNVNNDLKNNDFYNTKSNNNFLDKDVPNNPWL